MLICTCPAGEYCIALGTDFQCLPWCDFLKDDGLPEGDDGMEYKHTKFGKGVKFERIRRITGYLVGTMEKWNDAKKAEERDRVKHGMQG